MPLTYESLRERVGLREKSASLGALVGARLPELVAAGRSTIVRRFEAAKFAQVLTDGLDGAAPEPVAEPSAEDLLRQRLGPLRDRIRLVPMERPDRAEPLLKAVQDAVQALRAAA